MRNDMILERFLRYVQIDTQSDESSETTPSTPKQYNLLNLLKQELDELGIENSLDENGYLFARIQANTDEEKPKIGFLAHVDTSPDYSAENVKPQIHENYNGEKLVLSNQTVLDPAEFYELQDYVGQTLITTDGTTLLGADDKAGVTEIMTAVEYLVRNPEFKHGEIRIGFTPDEEIGRGADKFNVEAFDADFAYTMDGGKIGELEFENFNAAHAKIIINGRNVHPGYAKGKMLNALEIAMELAALLPQNEKPEYTTGYEGFYHLIGMNGTVEQTTIDYIIRDHDQRKFTRKKEFLTQAVELIKSKYSGISIDCDINDQYYNMKEKVSPNMHIIELAEKAFVAAGVTPDIKPIRGGTDGSRLSFMGLPCPNIFAGGHNFHGRYEFVPLESMQKAVEVILNIVKLA